MTTSFNLPGEGDTKIVERTRVREECEQCGELATKEHTYLLANARRNPASSGFGRDDISWCSDHEAFTCDECRRPVSDGYEWCSTFSLAPDNLRFAHMFLRWSEREIAQVDTHPKGEDAQQASCVSMGSAVPKGCAHD